MFCNSHRRHLHTEIARYYTNVTLVPVLLCENIKSIQMTQNIMTRIISLFEARCTDDKYTQLVYECTDPNPTKRIRTCMSVINALEHIGPR